MPPTGPYTVKSLTKLGLFVDNEIWFTKEHYAVCRAIDNSMKFFRSYIVYPNGKMRVYELGAEMGAKEWVEVSG